MSNTFFADVKNALQGGVSIAPQTYSTAGTKNGTGIDMQLSDGPVHAVIMTGDCGDANTNFTVTLEESSDNSTFTAIPGSPTSATYTGATAGDSLFVAVSTNERTKRYVRAVVTIATTGTASVIIAVAVMSRLKIIGGAGNYTTVT